MPDPFSPSDVMMDVDIEIEGGVEIRAAEIAARKRAAPAAADNDMPAKRTAASSRGKHNAREEQTAFLCWLTKTAWARPSDAAAALPARTKGRSWRNT
eukprot:7887501-Pyramimonas_sp.AAC.1